MTLIAHLVSNVDNSGFEVKRYKETFAKNELIIGGISKELNSKKDCFGRPK